MSPQPAGSAGETTTGDYVAYVEGKPIERARLEKRTESALTSLGVMEITDEMRLFVKRTEFAGIVSKIVIEREVEAKGVGVTDDELNAEVGEIIEKVGGEDALLAMLGTMGEGHSVSTVEGFKEWKRSEMNREALIRKIGGDVSVDEDALKGTFESLMERYTEDRDAGRAAMMPARSFEEFVEQEKRRGMLVKFDEYIDGALSAAKIEVLDTELTGALEEYLSLDQSGMGLAPMSSHDDARINPHEPLEETRGEIPQATNTALTSEDAETCDHEPKEETPGMNPQAKGCCPEDA